MKAAVLTGGTGLLGAWLATYLAKQYDKLILIARPKATQSAEERVSEALRVISYGGQARNEVMSKIHVLNGDVELSNLGLTPADLDWLAHQNVEDLFHSAALAEFEVPYERISITNVKGTNNAVTICRQLASISQCRFHFISTVAVAGSYRGIFTESNFSNGQAFNNTYEQTKYEAEQLVRESGLEFIIYRPGILTGDSDRGITTNFKMLYQPIHFLALGLFQNLPGDPDSQYSFVPVDAAAKAIAVLSHSKLDSGRIFHLIGRERISLGDLVDSVCDYFGSKKPILQSAAHFPNDQLSLLQWRLVKPFLPYFNYPVVFNAEVTNQVLDQNRFIWPTVNRAFMNRLYQYCRECGFVRKPTVKCT